MYDEDYETACDEIISRVRAIRFIEDHGHHKDSPEGVIAFFAEYGEKDGYTGKEVLDWLGY